MDRRRARTLALAIAGIAGLTGCDDGLCRWYPGETCSGTIQVGAEVRSYRLYVPPTYEPALSGLVLDFHGSQTGAKFHQEHVSRMTAKADEEGFVLVYPQAAGKPARWRTGPGSEQDVAFVAQLLDLADAGLGVSRSRVFATGVSTGGAMVHRLACDLSDRIGAFAPVVGANSHAAWPCAPERPVPLQFIFGEQDPVVPWPDGAPPVVQPPPDLAAGWAARNGAAPRPPTAGPAFDTWTWEHPTDPHGDVTLVLGHHLGHAWPSSAEHGFDANELVWGFFSEHLLP